MAFDTHASVKKLQEAGFTTQQAEAQVEVLRAVVEENLATKQDLKELGVRLEHKIEQLRLELRGEIELVRRDTKEMEAGLRRDMKEMESRITIRLGGIVVAGFTLMAALFGVVIALVAA